MNFNETANSQKLPKSYLNRLNADFQSQVKDQSSKGNFLGIVNRGFDDSPLVNLFIKHWEYLQGDVKIRALPMTLKDGQEGGPLSGGIFPDTQTLMNNGNFMRSDHASFWLANNRDFYASFKAVHLTDTG